jgi:26S proteasome regulatory subunit T3
MITRAVAAMTKANFIRVNGSEFVQKYLGEGPRMVRDVFRLARDNAPAIIFIDEVDAIATKRFDAQTGADREVQRILLELLTQMDGFDQSVNVKVIMATNRQDTLDPALLRPGRLDRKVGSSRLLLCTLCFNSCLSSYSIVAQVEFPIPDRRQKRLIFGVCTSKMSLADDVDLESFVARPDKLSGAEIASVCLEAGMQAVRKNRYIILQKDFDKAFKVVLKKDNDDYQFYK